MERFNLNLVNMTYRLRKKNPITHWVGCGKGVTTIMRK